MNDRHALTAAIMADPDEDTPRLALADWLDEHGDKHDQARAEFIRLQVRAAALPAGKERTKLEASAAKLEAKHRKAWLSPLAALGGKFTPDDYIGFRRGMLSYVWADTGEFLLKKWQSQLPEAFATVGVEELNFYSPTKRIGALTSSPALRFVARVQYPEADDAALAVFGTSPHCAHLSALDLQEVLITDKGLKAFAATATMPNLRLLALTTEGALTTRKPKFGAAGLLALLGGGLPRLDALEIGGLAPEKFDAETFFTDPAVRQLKELAFDFLVVPAGIVASPHLVNLRALRLHDQVMTDADVDALLASHALKKLTELSLGLYNTLSPASEAKLRKRFGDGLNLDYLE